MKKFAALVLAGAMTLGLAACGGSSSSTASSAASSAATSSAVAADVTISVQPVFAATLYPCRSRLDTEMVILFLCQSALSVGTFQYTLCQRHRCRNAVPAHLCHRKIGISFCIFLILAHYYI